MVRIYEIITVPLNECPEELQDLKVHHDERLSTYPCSREYSIEGWNKLDSESNDWWVDKNAGYLYKKEDGCVVLAYFETEE